VNNKQKTPKNEVCHVYYSISDQQLAPNPDEIDAGMFIHYSTLIEQISLDPNKYTPWFKMEWEAILQSHLSDILGELSSIEKGNSLA